MDRMVLGDDHWERIAPRLPGKAWRHLVENFFCKIKEFHRLATRYDKTDKRFKAMIHHVGIVLATR